MTTPDPTLAEAILRAVARTRVEADLPAAILAAIGETHVVIERGRWERCEAVLRAAGTIVSEDWVIGEPEVVKLEYAVEALQPGDLDEG